MHAPWPWVRVMQPHGHEYERVCDTDLSSEACRESLTAPMLVPALPDDPLAGTAPSAEQLSAWDARCSRWWRQASCAMTASWLLVRTERGEGEFLGQMVMCPHRMRMRASLALQTRPAAFSNTRRKTGGM